MSEQWWERLAEAQRINQEIDAEFRRALSLVGSGVAERILRTTEQAQAGLRMAPRRYA